MVKIFKYIWNKLSVKGLFFVLIAILLMLLLLKDCSQTKNKNNIHLDDIVRVDTINHKTTAIYSDKELKELKKENKELYDSLKRYKKQLDLVIMAKYVKKGEVKKVITDTIVDSTKTVNTYTYKSNPKDSFEYELKIGSYEKPKWYSLKYKIKDDIVITNRHDGNRNQMDIKTKNGLVTNVSVIHKPKEKPKFINRFAIGPSIGIGYDVKNNRIEPFVGISLTYNIFYKK